MRITLNIQIQVQAIIDLDPLMERMEALRRPVQQAMGEAFHGDVMANFGSVGFDRPWVWQPLSPTYARKVGRSFATLYVTGALKDTVKLETTDPEKATVTMGNTPMVPYALAHHHGNPPNFGWTMVGSGELPARRVFPLDVTDQPTKRVLGLVEDAAKAAVKKELT